SIEVAGQPLDMQKTYTLATNDFMAAGGDEYTMFADHAITGEYPALDEALITYIQKIDAVNTSVEGRITAANADSGKSSESTQPAAPAPQAPVPTAPSPVTEQTVYIVQRGDTLWAISREYGVTWQQLAEWNRISNPHLIFPGQRIEIH